MRGTRAKALRSDTNPHPGRKFGGNPNDGAKVGSGSRDRVRSLLKSGIVKKGRKNGMSDGS